MSKNVSFFKRDSIGRVDPFTGEQNWSDLQNPIQTEEQTWTSEPKDIDSILNDFCQEMNTTLEEAESKLLSIVSRNNIYFKSKDTKKQALENLYFTALSFKNPSIKNILEIGTGKGDMTSILSTLWPDSEIVTCDIPEYDPEFKELAIRKEDDAFERNINRDNITFHSKNSFFLPTFAKKKFDLIWVDGGHDYPSVAWDIMFAYNNCKKGGYIFMHDVSEVKHDVLPVINYIKSIIPEEIKDLPFAGYLGSNVKTCYLRKG